MKWLDTHQGGMWRLALSLVITVGIGTACTAAPDKQPGWQPESGTSATAPAEQAPKKSFGACSSHDLTNFSCE